MAHIVLVGKDQSHSANWRAQQTLCFLLTKKCLHVFLWEQTVKYHSLWNGQHNQLNPDTYVEKGIAQGKMNFLKQVVWENWSALCHGLPCPLQVTLKAPVMKEPVFIELLEHLSRELG